MYTVTEQLSQWMQNGDLGFPLLQLEFAGNQGDEILKDLHDNGLKQETNEYK